MKHYEVQHHTLCQCWINTWLIDDKPQTFATRAEAEREAEQGYDASEFRIVEVLP
jgi:hypothetical protein